MLTTTIERKSPIDRHGDIPKFTGVFRQPQLVNLAAVFSRRPNGERVPDGRVMARGKPPTAGRP